VGNVTMADYNAVPNTFQFPFQLLMIRILVPLDAGILKCSFFFMANMYYDLPTSFIM
jgi:hypothetical protein